MILALWALAILAALAVASAAHLSAALRLARFADNEVHASLAARAGVELALMTVFGETNAWESIRLTRAMDEVAVGARGRVRLVHYPETSPPAADTAHANARPGLMPEEARISLNVYSRRPGLLASLLCIAPPIDGLPADTVHPDEGRAWVRLLIEYRQALVEERNAMRENMGLTQDGPFPHNGGPEPWWLEPEGFRSWHEVLATAQHMASEEGIDGYRLRAALERIRPYTTLYAANRVHFDGAGPVVLAAVAMAAGADERSARALADHIVRLRPAEGFGEVPTLIEGLRSEENHRLRQMRRFLTHTSEAFGGTAEGWMTANREPQPWFTGRQSESAPPLTRRIDFTVQREPPGVLYWHEY